MGPGVGGRGKDWHSPTMRPPPGDFRQLRAPAQACSGQIRVRKAASNMAERSWAGGGGAGGGAWPGALTLLSLQAMPDPTRLCWQLDTIGAGPRHRAQRHYTGSDRAQAAGPDTGPESWFEITLNQVGPGGGGSGLHERCPLSLPGHVQARAQQTEAGPGLT